MKYSQTTIASYQYSMNCKDHICNTLGCHMHVTEQMMVPPNKQHCIMSEKGSDINQPSQYFLHYSILTHACTD